MPFSPEQLDNWFTYHTPTEEQLPLYSALREKEAYLQTLLVGIPIVKTMNLWPLTDAKFRETLMEGMSGPFREFAEAINTSCPDSADKTAAMRCLRLARNFLNEFVMSHAKPAENNIGLGYLVLTSQYLMEARFQANASIACGGK